MLWQLEPACCRQAKSQGGGPGQVAGSERGTYQASHNRGPAHPLLRYMLQQVRVEGPHPIAAPKFHSHMPASGKGPSGPLRCLLPCQGVLNFHGTEGRAPFIMPMSPFPRERSMDPVRLPLSCNANSPMIPRPACLGVCASGMPAAIPQAQGPGLTADRGRQAWPVIYGACRDRMGGVMSSHLAGRGSGAAATMARQPGRSGAIRRCAHLLHAIAGCAAV